MDTPSEVVRPRICIVPPSVRTAGPQAAALAGTVGIDLDPTQKATLDWTLGADASRHWSAFEALVLQGRQNGKTVGWLLVRVLAGLLLFDEELILFSAHQGRTTAECFRRLRRIIGDNPSLGARIVKVDQSRGNESVELATSQRVQFVARSTNSGRGFTGDCVILDEAQSLTTDDLGARGRPGRRSQDVGGVQPGLPVPDQPRVPAAGACRPWGGGVRERTARREPLAG